ncbi:DEAD-box ATP-dependent RNA helicase 5 [Artemisia annua]|uniref:RNA helicase n=1 Tax=Artemisia annua TaxID=35608 RepID=A0A2U1QHD0_ARTAN|nr:DEAD-box ATP-dependent RNA helicase 5 [Artemisia annua]
MPTINDSLTKSEKKSKKKDHKRKHQDPEPESEPALESTKKDKKKKKKDELANGSELELSEKKKKKKKKQKTEQEQEPKKDEDVVGAVAVVGGVDEVRQSEDNVVVSGKDINDPKYKALSTFAESNLSDELLECCKNFAKPSPIQSNSWPFLLHGRDFIGIAKTGSGKTLAFGIPAMNHILNKRKNKTSKKVTPLCLALAPTRELAQQIYDVISEAGKPSGVRSVCVYGGTSKGPQISALKSGVDIVVGTPGRLKDLIEMGVCQLQEVSFVVLDEADRMLDMGFEPEVRSILSQTNSVRQVVMFSATWPQAVHQLAQEFMDPNPVKVVVGSEDLAANHDVMQIVEVLEDRARDERLVTLLEKYHKSRRNRVLVFVLYKKEASRVENMLQRRGWKVVSISGDKAQRARTEALQLFKDGSSPLLYYPNSDLNDDLQKLHSKRFLQNAVSLQIATDVAARGLDIPDVEVVINYSFPLTTEDYVHRIGRTGRAVRQVVMFSATWPQAVHQLAQEFMDPNPVKVVVGSEDLAANHDVMQIVEVLEDRARDERLVTLLEKYHKSRRNRVLVFVLYKKEASRVENMLQRRGWKVVSISGDKAQRARTEALQLFKDGSSPLLIATDVAARGLDIPDVEVVINYSFPLTTEDYVHRIGRTGRAGKKGVAHTFFMKENKGLSGELINVLREAGQNVPTNLLNFGTHVKKKESKLYGAHFKEISADAPKATKITFDSDDED